MRLVLKIETRNHSRGESARVDGSSDGLRVVRDAWRKLASSTPESRDRLRQWVGGAVAVYAAMTGRDGAEVLDELDSEMPVPKATAVPEGMPVFRSGRSVPPPPRSPGAQRPVAPDELEPLE